MWKTFDFECDTCKHVFDALVYGLTAFPECCPECSGTKGFTRQLCAPPVPTKIIIDYPGSKRFKAGYVHSHADRPAEKQRSQVSMHGTGGTKRGR